MTAQRTARTSEYGESTRALHTPVPQVVSQEPLAPPIHRATTYAFDDAQEYADVLGGVEPGWCYARIDSPTAEVFAAAVAALEGVGVPYDVVGQPFASGMAAISTTLLSLTAAGRYASRMYGTLDGSDGVGNTYQGFYRYLVVDLRATVRAADHLTFGFGVDNVNNDRYFLFHPFPQRTFQADLHWAL